MLTVLRNLSINSRADFKSPIGFTGKMGTHSMGKTLANRVYNKLGKDLVRPKRPSQCNLAVQYLSFVRRMMRDCLSETSSLAI